MYVPLALRYRPRNWGDVVGQEVSARTLHNMIRSGRHGILGPRVADRLFILAAGHSEVGMRPIFFAARAGGNDTEAKPDKTADEENEVTQELRSLCSREMPDIDDQIFGQPGEQSKCEDDHQLGAGKIGRASCRERV